VHINIHKSLFLTSTFNWLRIYLENSFLRWHGA